MRKALAVVSGDIHYDLSTLAVADKATRLAIEKANTLQIPFVANGDTHNTKANLRGECVNAMIETFKLAKVQPIINIGNHCKINQKSIEHSLNFLAPFAQIIAVPEFVPRLNSYVIPYNHDVQELRDYLKTLPYGATIIAHQGVTSANFGEYLNDTSALSPKDLAKFRTILSHYHNRQDIECGPREGFIGLASFVGSPYTTTFAECSDLPKGFQVLYNDGSLEFVPTNLREHKVLDLHVSELNTDRLFMGENSDIVWIKIRGPSSQLSTLTKSWIAQDLDINQDFRLDLIPDDVHYSVQSGHDNQTQEQSLDALIDSTTEDAERKERLKQLWKGMT